jgi:precorrin-6A/cobalt-precorrin-6A reductase
VDGELALMREHAIDVLVTKDSGGEQTAAKLAAARQRGIPVVIVRRPPAPAAPTVDTVDAAVEWIRRGSGAA